MSLRVPPRRPAARVRRDRTASAALLAALAALACGGDAKAPEPASAGVVVVLVDQLRQDAAERWMPEVNARAARGVVFENMRAAAPWTYPSVVSMFSGLHSQQHGATGHPRDPERLSVFDPALPLLPGLLREAGFHTAAFVANPFLQTWNPFHEGFDHYEVDAFIGSQGPLRGFPEAVWRPESMFADSVNAHVRAYFDARPLREPEFVYVHYIDVHGPWKGAPFEPGYTSAIRYVDGKVRELHDYFRERYAGRLLFLVTSDHGRELGDDLVVGAGRPWRMGKGSVHDFNLRIPFAALPSRQVTRACRIGAPVSNVDVAPTVLEWTGQEVPGRGPGRSLAGALRCEPEALAELRPDRPIYARMRSFNMWNDGVVVSGRKLVRHFLPRTGKPLRHVLYDLSADPRETHPLEEPLDGPLEVLHAAAGTQGIEYASRTASPSEETLERLRHLGYLSPEEADASP